MANSTEKRVADLLTRLPTEGMDALKHLIWRTLNYDRVDTPLPTRAWPQTAQDALHGAPRLLAAHAGDGSAFHIIVAQLAPDQPGRTTPLSLSAERRIVTQLLPDHPYALFIFTDTDARYWHFVNVTRQRPATPPTPQTPAAPAQPVIRRIAVGPDDQQLRTATERIAMLDVAAMTGDTSAPAIQQRHDAAFDVEAVTEAFFTAYRRTFERTEAQITGLDDADELRLFTQRLFNRLLFIVFLERKGWLTFAGRTDYLRALWTFYRDAPIEGERNFYRDRLKLLFFSGLNNPANADIVGIHAQGPIPQRIGQVPYLNGGLFEQEELDQRAGVVVPDAVFADIIDTLLSHYNFTVTESTPLDVEVAVDPEMLGRIFEELVTGRHESGSYYTRKPIVAFMCREALKGYLADVCPREEDAALAAFVDHRDAGGLRAPEAILAALRTVRVCDPACGSGAYLVGMLHELMDLRQALFVTHATEANAAYDRKLETIQTCLYGVDIDPFAVNIARLRLWLSLIVEYDGPTPPPLPNLAYKIEVGDSLTGPAPEQLQPNLFHHQTVQDYFELKTAFLTAHGAGKRALRDKITAAQEEIAAWAGSDRYPGAFDWTVQFAEIFTPEVAGAATLTGEMTGVVNATAGQMQLAPTVGRPPGFDILVMNPPYVDQRLLSAGLKKRLKKVYPEVHSGTADLYVYFFNRAVHLLRTEGTAAIISSSKWLLAGYGRNLRRHLKHSTDVTALIDFGDLPLFNATAYPLITIFRRRENAGESAFQALQVRHLNLVDDLSRALKEEGWMQEHSSLTGRKWMLLTPAVQHLMAKLSDSGKPLSVQLKAESYRGITTGRNLAFVIDQATMLNLVKEDQHAIDIVKPWIRGRNVHRWRIDENDEYVIFTRRGIDIEAYPSIKHYLLKHKAILTPGTDGGRKSGSYKWYEIQDSTAYYQEFDKPKIVWAKYGITPEFAYDTDGLYTANTVFILPTQRLWPLGILNSRLIQWYASKAFNTVRGGYIEWIPTNVERLPLRQPDSDVSEDIESLVSQLLSGSEPNSQQRCGNFERDLNALVYKLYDLTPDEIALIEKETCATDPDR